MTSQHRRFTPMRARLLGAALLGALLTACGSVSTGNAGTGTLDTTTTSRTDVMTFRPSSLPTAYLGETYDVPFGVTGGVGPYAYRVTTGKLPTGLSISGGKLVGQPSQSGEYKFTVQATDANLSTKVQEYTLNVGALPPLTLEPTLPPSEIRGETRIPLVVKSPRGVRAARLTWDLGTKLKVTRVQPSDPGSILFWQQSGNVLTVDVGFRSSPRTDTRIALITVKPTGSVRVPTDKLGFEARDGAGKLLAEKKLPAPPAPASPAQPSTPASKPAPSPSTVPLGPNKPANPATPAPATTPAAPASAAGTPADVNSSPLPSPATPTPSSPAPSSPAPSPVTPPNNGGGATPPVTPPTTGDTK